VLVASGNRDAPGEVAGEGAADQAQRPTTDDEDARVQLELGEVNRAGGDGEGLVEGRLDWSE
jgi:hypothetical protein